MQSHSEILHFPISIQRNQSYSIVIGVALLDGIANQIKGLGLHTPVHVITDSCVHQLYGSRVLESLQQDGLSAEMLIVPEGETSKCLSVVSNLYQQLLSRRAARRDVVLALGGGMIMDLAGFVAATYMRGLPYINIPSSLTAQLDAAVGGKVGINHACGKNLIGAFHHPVGVYIDPEMLSTLPVDEIRNGLAEAIKVAIIGSEALFDFIESHYQEILERNTSALSRLVIGAVETKLQLLLPDPFETDLKRALNFGHTLGHLLEALKPSLSHGRAISIGMAVATRLALSKGLCDFQTADRILGLLQRVGLPVHADNLDLQSAKESFRLIEAVRGRSANYVVPTRIGSCAIMEALPFDAILEHL